MQFVRAMILVGLFILTGCGGGGSSDSSNSDRLVTGVSPDLPPADGSAESGTDYVGDAFVGIMLTDAPGDVHQLIATIVRIELVGEQTVTVFEGSETVDLLQLLGTYDLFSVGVVPSGPYEIVRLIVTDVVIVEEDDRGNLIERDVTLSSTTIDVALADGTQVNEGEILFLEIDFDVEKALYRTRIREGDLILEPVVFAEVRRDFPTDRFTRVHGTVDQITSAGFRLCDTQLTSNVENRRRSLPECIDVSADADTSFFSSDGQPGLAVDAGDLEAPLTVVGYLNRRVSRVPFVPPGHRPPPGSCKLWYLDRPPGHQPSSRPCDDFANETIPDNAVVIDHGGKPQADLFGIDALVVERGMLDTFQQLRGEVTTDVADGQFDFLVEENQGVVTDEAILSQLYPETRIFSLDGIERTADVMQPDLSAYLDGVLVLNSASPDLLRVAFVLVGLNEGTATRLRATVVSLESNTRLTVNTDSGERCVDAAGAGVFEVSRPGDRLVSERIDLTELRVEQVLDIYGQEAQNNCFDAETILAEAE